MELRRVYFQEVRNSGALSQSREEQFFFYFGDLQMQVEGIAKLNRPRDLFNPAEKSRVSIVGLLFLLFLTIEIVYELLTMLF